jgi:hypothetical protein
VTKTVEIQAYLGTKQTNTETKTALPSHFFVYFFEEALKSANNYEVRTYERRPLLKLKPCVEFHAYAYAVYVNFKRADK